MLTEHVRIVLRTLLLLLALATIASLSACGGGGGSPGTPGPTPPPAATTGTLVVTTTGLPAGVNASVRVTGPNNFQQDLTASQTLASLAAGSYSVAAAPVNASGVSYTPTPATQSAVVTAGGTVTATVSYGGTAVSIALSEVAANLENPTWLSAPTGDTRLFVLERPGRIRIVQNGNVLTLPFLDISGRVFTGGEGGLLSLAFDPAFARNGYFYIYYTDPQQNIVIERFTASSNPSLADPTSNLVILRIPHANFTNHFGGQVAFGPDGFLYLGTGDGGGAGDPLRNGQNLNSLLGKLLRIDVATAVAGQPFTIPPSNPYINQAGRRGEIWAAGLRNPWRFSWDSGQLYLSDVGQDRREEINISVAGTAGLNYGWNTMEGTLCFNATTCDRTGLTLPVFEYDHGANDANGCSITGGFVYRGSAMPELAGRYFYSDYCRGFLKSFLATGGNVTEQRDWNISGIGNVISFGQDGVGELYLTTSRGSVYKIGRSPAP
ncbi:PQQ-dependent sugar dehydrogenase [Telluria aromaticivorans]|uniref:PQQ-dependent sugar dehydrogenase n=1 Tax=Telluria aromaticivorans TaxID=2725995 RepID=A0A7Y2K172_9BURK|nr:PQQ-dependent sugar dehydrogenase [Telluria aromaticivorans]NNG24781.1 PQQ-dependent sugar dehydrogenase [Telluria aromaticivorans]